jgi:hypothetical protein
MRFVQPLTEMHIRGRKIRVMSLGSRRRPVLEALPPSVSRPSRQCGILNISQAYRSSRSAAEIGLLFFYFFTDYETPLHAIFSFLLLLIAYVPSILECRLPLRRYQLLWPWSVSTDPLIAFSFSFDRNVVTPR